jgi:GNAT superfamily N-acetyltransferase
MSTPHQTLNLPQVLGDGLVMHLAKPADTEVVADFNTRIHPEEDEPPEIFRIWTKLLMSGQHPTTSAADFVIVEDTKADHKIVSATCLIPQIWAYDSIPFKVGRPELVGTDPAYRRRGLTRAIFRQIHAMSAAYGHKVQGITGIPWFYRQFGYEYALDLGGSRKLPISEVPVLKENEAEPYQVRQATEADIPALIRLSQRYSTDKLVTVPLDETRWRYEVAERSYIARTYCLIDSQEQLVGTYTASAVVWASTVELWGLVVDEGVSLRAVLPTVVRALKAQGEAYLAEAKDGANEAKKLMTIRFALGPEHPAYNAFDLKLGPPRRPYGWYIRVPDLPGFIRHIAPALEKRLANSVMSGFSGELKITFYRGGLRLFFQQGKLTWARDWQAPEANKKDWAGAGFPPLVFLQLLFGRRSLDELHYAFPDCWADEEPALLLNALFPKRASWVVALE